MSIRLPRWRNLAISFNVKSLSEIDTIKTGSIATALELVEACLRDANAGMTNHGELRNEARAVLRVAANINDAQIFGDSGELIDESRWERLQAVVRRRCAGEPLAYIEGIRGFHKLDLQVNRDVLVPRPETELIVDSLLELAPATEFSMLDAGTGSGAIALAVANERPDAHVVATDISPAALQVAQRNGSAHNLTIEWIESDWYAKLTGRRFDFICSNPPYICRNDPHFSQLRHEPTIALDGGSDGLDAVRQVLHGCPEHLNHGGRLLLEHGHDQATQVASIATDTSLQRVDLLRDLGGHERVSVFQLRQT